MQTIYVNGVCLAAFLLLHGILAENLKCVCEDRTNYCAYRRKTVIEAYDLCSYQEIFYFRGNYLRTLPELGGKQRKIDISMNEFGLSKRYSINIARTVELDVSSNYLSDLKFLRSTYSCDLVVLNISNNAIAKLENDHQGCRNIFVLRIANNKLTELTNDSFSHQELLKYLDVSGNPLRFLARNTFSSLRVLETLDISNARVSQIPMGLFSELSLLQHLHLAGNNLTSLAENVFTPLKSLVTLFLQRNAIRELQPGVFDTLFHLKDLDLDNNQLQHLEPALFRRLHSLERLSARNNRLRALPSLHLTTAPLRVALFSENAITKADELAVRALWRPGFKQADLAHNPVDKCSFAWAHEAPDVNVFTKGSLTDIGMVIMDRGVVVIQN